MAKMKDISSRDLMILCLHDQEGVSFKELADMYGVTYSGIRQLYLYAARKRREERIKEFTKEENKKIVPVEITLGEVVILSRILQEYIYIAERKKSYDEKDIYVNIAKKIKDELIEVDKQNRERYDF